MEHLTGLGIKSERFKMTLPPNLCYRNGGVGAEIISTRFRREQDCTSDIIEINLFSFSYFKAKFVGKEKIFNFEMKPGNAK